MFTRQFGLLGILISIFQCHTRVLIQFVENEQVHLALN